MPSSSLGTQQRWPRFDPQYLAPAGLPTMYDLPSEDPKEPGLPDEFHLHQPHLLRATFRPQPYLPNGVFVGADMNIYYDRDHPLWHKRPDWFAVLGVSRFYAGHDLRLSYVVWQERVVPYLIVELLSPGTEDEDLGETLGEAEGPPTKWEVYEQILGVPYYVTFSRYTNEVRYFVLVNGFYREVSPAHQRLWLPDAEVGLAPWKGTYDGRERTWLRFYDAQGEWIQTPEEQVVQTRLQAEQEHSRAEQERQRAEQEHQRAEQERQRAEQERQHAEQERQRAELEHQRAELEHSRAERLAARLRALGMDPEA